MVHAAGVPRAAAHKAPQGKPRALEGTMYLDCFARVARAGGVEAAPAAEEGREQQLVGSYQAQQQGFHRTISITGVNAFQLDWRRADGAASVWSHMSASTIIKATVGYEESAAQR